MKWIVQILDHEEGSAARWTDLANSTFSTREEAVNHFRKMRDTTDEWCLYSYRVAEIGSPLYYSQPTDKGEY